MTITLISPVTMGNISRSIMKQQQPSSGDEGSGSGNGIRVVVDNQQQHLGNGSSHFSYLLCSINLDLESYLEFYLEFRHVLQRIVYLAP